MDRLISHEGQHVNSRGLLVASPQMVDVFFSKTVILLCDYSEEGAMGIVINRLTGIESNQVLDQMGPPILSSIIISLGPWSGKAYEGASALNVLIRFAVWGGGSVTTLLFLFDQRELTHYEPR